MNIKRFVRLVQKQFRSESARRSRVLNTALKDSKKVVLEILIRRYVSAPGELEYYLRLLREL